MENIIKFKKEDKEAILPNYAHPEDAGMDIYSNEDKIIPARSWGLVKTGFSMELPAGYEAQVRSKSGLSLTKVEHFKTVEVTEISSTTRGDGAFGSTGLGNNSK